MRRSWVLPALVLLPACAATQTAPRLVGTTESVAYMALESAPMAEPAPSVVDDLVVPASPPAGIDSANAEPVDPIAVAPQPFVAPPLTPSELQEKMPLLLSGSRYIVTADDAAGGALLLRTSDERIVSPLSLDHFADLQPRLAGAEALVPMQQVTSEFGPDGYPNPAVFSDRGLRIAFHEPNLLVYVEKTGETIYRKRPTWWSMQQPPESPGQEALPKDERFRCPAPQAVLTNAWVASDHQAILLRVDYFQPVCVCGSETRHEWHTLQLPFAPAPVDPPADG
jgi:hypothetical protein